MANNKRCRLMVAATVNGKRSYYKPVVRSTGWPDPGAVLVNGRKVRIHSEQTIVKQKATGEKIYKPLSISALLIRR
jgi:hypothetical protein